MRIRTSALSFLLLTSAAAWLPSATPGAIGVAHAQDRVTELAREKFLEGVKAYDAGRFEEARTHFLQAYALKRHPAVLLNLGQSELKAGYVEDGGNHLQQFLREQKDAKPEQKEAARAGIAEAQKKTGFVIVIVDADGADVAVDGQPAGKAPLLDPYFVKPGTHKATASLQGKSVTAEFEAKRGGATPVTLTLGMQGVASPEPEPAPAPAPAAVPAPMPQPGVPPAQGYPPPGGPMGQPPPGPAFGPMPPSGGRDTGRQDFIEWYKDRPIAWALTGVAGVGLIGTLGFGIAAGVADANADDVAQQIRDEEAINDMPGDPGFVPGGRTPCGNRDGGGDLSYYAQACQTLRDNLDARKTDLIVMGVFIGVTVAGAAGTVLYYFLDPDNQDTAERRTEPRFTVAPLLSPHQQGLGIAGSF